MNDAMQYWAPLATSAALAAPHLSLGQLSAALSFVAALAIWEAWPPKARVARLPPLAPAPKRRRPLRVVASWDPHTPSEQGTPGPPASPPESRYRGTVWLARAGKWRAQLYVGKNPQTGAHSTANLGQFDTEEEAARAYDRALLEHGFHTRTPNFPDAGFPVPELATPSPSVPAEEPSTPVKRPPGRPRGKFGPGARAAIELSRDQGLREGIAIGLARAKAAAASCR